MNRYTDEANQAADEEPPPNYRFILADERTFLAWIRSALALMAAGVGVHAVALPPELRHRRGLLSDLCLTLAVAVVVTAYRRWRAGHHALHRGGPLPPARTVGLLTAVILLVAMLADALIAIK